LRRLKDNFLLNQIFVLIGADPGRASTKSWRVARVSILACVVTVSGAKHLESQRRLLGRNTLVSDLIEVIMNNLAQVNESVLLNLNLSDLVDLDAGSVDNTQVTNIVFAILADNHELGFPKFFVIRNLILVGLTFTNLVKTGVTINSDAQILDFFSIDSFKIQVQFVSGWGVRERVKRSTLEIDAHLHFRRGQFTNLASSKLL